MGKKKIWLVGIVMLIFLGCIFAPFFIWKGLPSTALNIWIVDKTVPNQEYQEHKGLVWALNSQKILSEKTGKPISYATDYFGVIPSKNGEYTLKEIPETKEVPDLIYLTDTEGITEDESSSEVSYGNLSEEEVRIIRDNLGNGNVIIGEYGINSQANKDTVKDIFKVAKTNWSGTYVTNLELKEEIPSAIIQNFEKQESKVWDFSGAGYLLISDSGDVVVLREGVELAQDTLQFNVKKEYQEEFQIDDAAPFQQWFEIVTADKTCEILADFSFETTESGKEALERFGLSDTFPAIVRSQNKNFTSYYFAGDFAENSTVNKGWNYYGYAKLQKMLLFRESNHTSDFYWSCYIPLMEQILNDVKEKQEEVKQTVSENENIGLEPQVVARTFETGFQIMKQGEWTDFYAKGVNIGSSTPGKWFTEFVYEENLYLDWFEQIAGMNANSIRVYTLMPPQFYSALLYFNEQHEDKKLWLYQEIWPEENPEGKDYLTDQYNKTYQKEIEYVIDALHGNKDIAKRAGRAYGLYTADVSKYILGFLVGRELEPEEVISTNALNPLLPYEGMYLYTTKTASPTESWLAMSCDYVIRYEVETYQWQHPVGIVSWPTLDPVEHDSEWNIEQDKSLEYNDRVSVDINHIEMRDNLKAGFFGAYHIYPNYPDFMNNELSYADYTDSQGVFRYGGYLKEFIQNHKKYPALVAEYGLATGMGNAHANPDGYSHGGLTEVSQGEGVVRMAEAIKREGYAGGIIFEWSDEWAKKTWTTEPYMVPYERKVFWHNAVDPEQNYGICSVETDGIYSEPYVIKESGRLAELSMRADATYLTITISCNDVIDFSKDKLVLGLDTYNRGSGNFSYTPDVSMNSFSGLEYVVEMDGEKSAWLLVQPEYNATTGNYMSVTKQSGLFETMQVLTNKERVRKDGSIIPEVIQNVSELKYGPLEKNSYYAWEMDGKKIVIRIPWMRIGVSDPSSMLVLDDDRKIQAPVKDELKTTTTDGILASAILIQKKDGEILGAIGNESRKPFAWNTWNQPTYKVRLKDSYQIIADYFEE